MPTIPIIPRRSFSFSTTTTITIIARLDASQWREGTLIGRLHVNGMGTGSSVAMNVKMIAPSEDDPAIEFAFGTAMATASFTTGDAVGLVARGAFTANFGHWVKVELVATKGSGACDFTISVDVNFKN